MRIPYVSNPSAASIPDERAVVARIQARHAPHPLQPLDLALLHSPPVADGWSSFLLAVRAKTSIDVDVREIAICLVAVCNEAWYEWDSHAPLAVATGVSQSGLDAFKRRVLDRDTDRPDAPNEKQWAVLLYADEMTRRIQVRDQTFALLHGLFDNQQVVETTETVSAYNCVSRFLRIQSGKVTGVAQAQRSRVEPALMPVLEQK